MAEERVQLRTASTVISYHRYVLVALWGNLSNEQRPAVGPYRTVVLCVCAFWEQKVTE